MVNPKMRGTDVQIVMKAETLNPKTNNSMPKPENFHQKSNQTLQHRTHI
jgi:hypothetical protein